MSNENIEVLNDGTTKLYSQYNRKQPPYLANLLFNGDVSKINTAGKIETNIEYNTELWENISQIEKDKDVYIAPISQDDYDHAPCYVGIPNYANFYLLGIAVLENASQSEYKDRNQWLNTTIKDYVDKLTAIYTSSTD